MMNARIIYDTTDSPLSAELEAIDEGLGNFNAAAAPLDQVRTLVCRACKDDGVLIGGAVARTWGECCEIQQLWVAEAYRRQGIGRELLAAVERETRRRGVTLVYLETFNFQCPDLYRAAGYVLACRFTGFPNGIEKFVMRKSLAGSRNC